MNDSAVEEIIAERKLTSVSNDNSVADLIVRLFRPRPSEGVAYPEFSCRVDIVGAVGTTTSRIYGVDAFQAIQLALRYISAALRLEGSRRALYWNEKGDDLGFPEQLSESTRLLT